MGPVGERIGEVVFNTSMTGYQEVLSDPSYAGQIIVFTAPQIGNVGWNAEDMESRQVFCTGFAIREASPVPSNWRSQSSFEEALATSALSGIEGIDTRALTRAIRQEGAQRGALTESVDDIDAVLERVRSAPKMEGQDLVKDVTCAEPYEWEAPPWHPPEKDGTAIAVQHHVVALDFGIKLNILRDLRAVGCRITVVPASTPAKEILALSPDGILLSNGPGDPAAVAYAAETVAQLLESSVPVFGICLGHQILSLALGARTFKLPFGHHGGNHPVKDLRTGKVEITSQNHGFAVDEKSLPDTLRVSHINLYDQTVEGIEVGDRPVFGIQYHPEASPGPRDANYLFQRFATAIEQGKR
jgi:carbamoyl-phosphate synthase small subunit